MPGMFVFPLPLRFLGESENDCIGGKGDAFGFANLLALNEDFRLLSRSKKAQKFERNAMRYISNKNLNFLFTDSLYSEFVAVPGIQLHQFLHNDDEHCCSRHKSETKCYQHISSFQVLYGSEYHFNRNHQDAVIFSYLMHKSCLYSNQRSMYAAYHM